MNEQKPENVNEAASAQSALNVGLGYRCDKCVFWKKVGNGDSDHEDDFLGECKRYPPQRDHDYKAKDYDGSGSESDWRFWEQPVTEGAEWCGEFKSPNVEIT